MSGNSAGVEGGGIYLDAGPGAVLRNSIISGNTSPSGPDLQNYAALSTTGTNLIGNLVGSGLSAGPGIVVGPATLRPLGNYGGPTPTMAPLPGSLAIDAAQPGPAVPGRDQRGRLRAEDGTGDGIRALDIGAFEVGTSIVTSVADSGPGSLRSIVETQTGHEWVHFNTDPAKGDVFDGTPAATITLASVLEISGKALHFDARSIPGGVTLSGNDATRVISVDAASTVEIDNMTITRGFIPAALDQGAGVFNAGTLTVRDSTILNNHSAQYGGACGNVGVLSLVRCTITKNTASFDAGGINNRGGTLLLTDSTASYNLSGGNGG
nr:hypothetical protein [Akkermansiaceae bacterium]